jgi:hypothetical protein
MTVSNQAYFSASANIAVGIWGPHPYDFAAHDKNTPRTLKIITRRNILYLPL